MKNYVIALLAVALTAVSVSHAADITGVITFKGTPPPEKEITPLEEDATCGPLHTDKPTTHFYVVGPNGELADVVVSLNMTGKSTGASAHPPYWIKRAVCMSRRFWRCKPARKSSLKIPIPASTTFIVRRPSLATRSITTCKCPAARI